MARPKKQLDEGKIANLAFEGANNNQIATLVGCDEGTIRGRFSDLVAKKRAERKLELRKFQWKAASQGNVTMLIWLGKQELDQADQHDITSGGDLIKFNIVLAKKPDGKSS